MLTKYVQATIIDLADLRSPDGLESTVCKSYIFVEDAELKISVDNTDQNISVDNAYPNI